LKSDFCFWSEWKASSASKLWTSTGTSDKALLVRKPVETTRFQRHCLYIGEVRWVFEGGRTNEPSFRASKQKCYCRTPKRLCINDLLHTRLCLILPKNIYAIEYTPLVTPNLSKKNNPYQFRKIKTPLNLLFSKLNSFVHILRRWKNYIEFQYI